MPVLTDRLYNLRQCKYKSLNWSHKPIFRQLLPAELKDTVRGRNEKITDGCLKELQVVLTCFKKHDFESQPCDVEIKNFRTCFATLEATESRKKQLESQGLIINEETNLSRKQVNMLLQRNPQIKPHNSWKMDETYKYK